MILCDTVIVKVIGMCLAIQAQVCFFEIDFHPKRHDSLSNSEIKEKLHF